MTQPVLPNSKQTKREMGEERVFQRFYLFTYFLERQGEGGRKRRDTLMCGCFSNTPYWEPS